MIDYKIMEVYGYARVSSKDQNPERQINSLLEYGVKQKNILIDKESGSEFNRKNYNLLTGTKESAALLREGDTLVISSLDRFGRNYIELKEEWYKVTKEIKANIIVLDMPLLNTSNRNSDIDNTFIADLVFQILSYVAEKERKISKQRQKEGIDNAHKKGVKFGRPLLKFPSNFREIYDSWKSKKLTARECYDKLNVSRTGFYRLVQRFERGESTEY